MLISPQPESTAPISGKTGINQAISEACGIFQRTCILILNCQLKNSDKNDELNVLTAIFIY